MRFPLKGGGMGKLEMESEALLPIREVARRTGVNPVTLRAWERRYGLLVPARTDKGHRLYSESDVQRIEEILTWLARGLAIGRVRGLLDEGGTTAEPEDSWTQMVGETVEVVDSFATHRLSRHLEQLLAAYPLSLLLDRWLVPLHSVFCRRDRFGSGAAQGLFWQALSEQLAITLRAGRENLQRGGGLAPKILLVSFPGREQQAFAQFFCAAMVAAGFDAMNLGPEAVLGELSFVEEKLCARGTVCFSHNALPMAVLGDGLERALGSLRAPLWLAGGFVELQRRDLQQFTRWNNCSALPADTALALRQLGERLQ